MKVFHGILAVFVLSLVACGEEKEPAPNGGDPKPVTNDTPRDHGAKTELGTLTVAGKSFGIILLGKLVPGKEGAFEVHPNQVSPDELAGLNLYLWVEDQEGTQLSAPAKGTREGSALHFHVTPRASGSVPSRVVLRLRQGGTDERAGLPLDGHGHEHVEGPHHGVPATFAGGGVSGHLELKLHDDKGDLELWLGQDIKLAKPFDLTAILVE